MVAAAPLPVAGGLEGEEEGSEPKNDGGGEGKEDQGKGENGVGIVRGQIAVERAAEHLLLRCCWVDFQCVG